MALWYLVSGPCLIYQYLLTNRSGHWIEPSWFSLDASRGVETPQSKVFMRATVHTWVSELPERRACWLLHSAYRLRPYLMGYLLG